jgi:hypothetical protein
LGDPAGLLPFQVGPDLGGHFRGVDEDGEFVVVPEGALRQVVAPQEDVTPVNHNDFIVGGDPGEGEMDVHSVPGKEGCAIVVFLVKLVLGAFPFFQDDRYRHPAFLRPDQFFGDPGRLVVSGFRDLEEIEGAGYAFAGIPDPLEEGFRILLIAQKGRRCLEAGAGMNGTDREQKK